ncbi:MAG TPA: methionine--tRNA ligase [Kiloniellales bacterium]|nr:methionine--tRNA ligase [Kiloniellales bacterium]
MADSFYITSPIYYVNDAPHIGHAYTSLACDVLARFNRLDGKQVMFLTGTDEHGQKVEKAAQAAGIAPKAFVDKVSQNFRDLCRTMNFSNDDFIRTTEERHKHSVQALWRKLVEKGEIYLGKYAGWYAVSDEAFYGEDELTIRDGKRYGPSGKEVEWVEEPSYFFRLSAWRDRLLKFYDDNPDFIAPDTRRNEVISFVSGDLRDLSVSRTTFKWGIPVPNDPAHIMYVWIDALTNYITAAGYPDTASASFRTFWPGMHMVGKDILRFHAVYWPAMLMAADIAPPKRVFAHGWWTNEGQKISKSLGNVIVPAELVARYGLDPVRYFLLREVPFGQDGDFSHAAMVRRMNTDLANDLGNLAQRTLSFIRKNCDGRLPAPGALTEADEALLREGRALLPEVRRLLEAQAFNRALELIWLCVGEANRYIDAQAPWTLRKSDPVRMATVLYVLAETIRRVALLLQPFMPDAMAKLLDQLGVAGGARSFASYEAALAANMALPAPQGIFPRFVETEAAAQG